MQFDTLLWSINERLAGGEGACVPRLTNRWINEIAWLAQLDSDDGDEPEVDEDDLE